jgi:hypothetical protein
LRLLRSLTLGYHLSPLQGLGILFETYLGPSALWFDFAI